MLQNSDYDNNNNNNDINNNNNNNVITKLIEMSVAK